MNNLIIIMLLTTLVAGCASSSVFKPYPEQINPVIEKVVNNEGVNLKKEFLNKNKTKDKILYLLEQARIAQITGEIYLSKQAFQQAEEAIRILDDKAIYSLSGGLAQGSSILVNDNTIPYKAQGYERVLLHQFQAMNYLYQNDLQGAAVEIRKANLQQEIALREHQAQLAKVKQTARDNKVTDEIPPSVNNVYLKNDTAISQLKNSFQNAYTFYFSGIIYEMLGQDNDAYIDYKKALEINPHNSYVQHDVVRLARKLNMQDDLVGFRNLYNDLMESNKDDKGELIVFFEDGFITQKQEIKIPLPLSLDSPRFTAVSFPIYPVYQDSSGPLLMYEHANVIASSEVICDLNLIAIKALQEKVPALVVHQLIRTVSKAILTNQAEKQWGDLGAILVSFYNVFSENADLRSWLSLPSNIQVIRLSLTAGEHEFSFLQRDTGANLYLKVPVKAQSKKIIRIVRAGNKLYYINLN